MKKLNKKGFTLMEIMCILIILSIIYFIAFPIVKETIEKNKEKAYDELIINIENSGYYYSLKNDLGYSEEYGYITFGQLIEAKVLENVDKIINPITDEELEGCLSYRWIDNKYEFKYVETCPNTGA